MVDLEWVPVATACVQFFQSLGGAVFIAVAQALFQNGLTDGIHNDAPDLDPEIFINSGASQIKQILQQMHAEQFTDAVLTAYLKGLRGTYYVTLACAGMAFIVSCLFTWKKIQKQGEGKKDAGHSDVEVGSAAAAKAESARSNE